MIAYNIGSGTTEHNREKNGLLTCSNYQHNHFGIQLHIFSTVLWSITHILQCEIYYKCFNLAKSNLTFLNKKSSKTHTLWNMSLSKLKSQSGIRNITTTK